MVLMLLSSAARAAIGNQNQTERSEALGAACAQPGLPPARTPRTRALFDAPARAARLGGFLWTFCPIIIAQNATSIPALLRCGARGADCQTVMVCIEDSDLAEEVDRAMQITSEIFTTARVNVKWRHGESRRCPETSERMTIRVSLLTRTPSKFRPGALAYCLPNEYRHVVVLCDRILSANPDLSTSLLAHVIAHEITHILQGTLHHSREGIMKARWDHNDFAVMKHRPLTFTETDLQLIREGLDRYAKSPPIIEQKP